MKRSSSKAAIPLSDLLGSAAERMSQDLHDHLLTHPGELGTAREEIIRQFLQRHLPKRFEVSTGFAFDCAGRLSRQLDIVIFDSDACPRFEVPGGKFLFPCEAILAVGQVKSSVTSQGELKSAMENLASAKALDRSADGSAYDFRHHEKLCPTENHLHQIFAFLIITGRALNPQTVAATLLESAFNVPIQHLPNVILGLKNYLVTYCCDSGVCPNPMAASGVAVQTPKKSSDLILRFYLLLGQALNVTRTASLPYWQYLADFRDIPGVVYHSAVESPPPHLGIWSEGTDERDA